MQNKKYITTFLSTNLVVALQKHLADTYSAPKIEYPQFVFNFLLYFGISFVNPKKRECSLLSIFTRG